MHRFEHSRKSPRFIFISGVLWEVQRLRTSSLQVATLICIVAIADSGSPTLSGQQGSAAPSVSIAGTVTSVTPERLVIKGAYSSPLVIVLAKDAQVTKKSILHDFSDVHVGDKILMRGQWGPSGGFEANEVWVNFTAFYGRILSVHGDSYEAQVFTEGGEVTGETRKVVIDSDTMGEGKQLLPRSELVAGRYVQTFGIKMSDGSVVANRVLLYRPSSPIPAGTTIITPGGKVIKKSN